MNQESLQRIDGFLAVSITDLFSSHGIGVDASAYREAGIEDPFAATIGFASDDLHGVLVLTLARDIVERSLPKSLKAGKPGDDILADWTGELSNQMLGRLKNKFHASGVDISLGTPVVFMGKEMRHYSQRSPIQRALYFAEGSVLVEFHADFERDFEVASEGASGEAGPPEGEILFF
jgi:CheY-specific phosphatase CheX